MKWIWLDCFATMQKTVYLKRERTECNSTSKRLKRKTHLRWSLGVNAVGSCERCVVLMRETQNASFHHYTMYGRPSIRYRSQPRMKASDGFLWNSLQRSTFGVLVADCDLLCWTVVT